MRVALLPSGLPPAALGGLARPGSKLETLSVVGHGGAPTPLSAIEPFARAGLSLDLHGFVLDDAASDAACAAATRLIVGDSADGGALPRAKLLLCFRLVELHLRCEISEEDVTACLARLPLKALHLRGGEEGVDPDAIGALGELAGLRSLNLSSCLRNYYNFGEEAISESPGHECVAF